MDGKERVRRARTWPGASDNCRGASRTRRRAPRVEAARDPTQACRSNERAAAVRRRERPAGALRQAVRVRPSSGVASRTFRYISWYMCLSIFLASRYLDSAARQRLHARRRSRARQPEASPACCHPRAGAGHALAQQAAQHAHAAHPQNLRRQTRLARALALACVERRQLLRRGSLADASEARARAHRCPSGDPCAWPQASWRRGSASGSAGPGALSGGRGDRCAT